jgi:hypothetical protein
MLKRAASHLKGLATGFLNNAINNGVAGITSGFTSSISGSQAKVAKQVLGKSPLEIDDSPQESLKRDPLSFSFLQYPNELSTTEAGHYILFYSIANDFASTSNLDFKAASKTGTAYATFDQKINSVNNIRTLKTSSGETIKPVKTENSVLSSFAQNTRVTSAIALYMPPGVKVTYGMDYEMEAAQLSGTIGQAIGKAKSAETTAEAIGAAIGGVKGGLIDYGKNLIGDLTAGLEAGDPVRLTSKALGVAINPHEEIFFNKPQFRSFNYTFDFYPRSPEEVKKVNDIIFLFKYHAHPEMDNSLAGGRLFKVPSEYEIHYAVLDRENEYMNKISKCVLKTVDVQYGPENQFSTFEPDQFGASPTHYKLSLEFQETQFLTKKQIYEGY